MAKQMKYEGQEGVIYENSYWKPVEINLCLSDKRGLIVFYGYKDKEAKEHKKSNIGQKSYQISSDLFDKYFSVAILNQEKINVISQAYQFADDTKDLEDKSFFEEGVNV